MRDISSSELIRAKHPSDPLNSAVESPLYAPSRRLTDHSGHISALAWHPSEVVLATGAADASARIYHMTKNVFDQQTCDVLQHAVPGNIGMSEVAAVAWSPDGEKLATATFDGHMRLWSRNGAQCNAPVLKPRQMDMLLAGGLDDCKPLHPSQGPPLTAGDCR